MFDWMLVFRFLCHQMPARSPEFQGLQFPLCFRCAGFYGGLTLGYVSLAIQGGFLRSFPSRRLALLAAALTFAYPLDGWANALRAWNSPAWVRSLTGLTAGVAITVLLLPLAGRLTFGRLSSLPNVGALLWPLCVGVGFIAVLTHLT